MKSRRLDVLLIEDDRILGGALAQRLKLEGFGVRSVETCAAALRALQSSRPDFVLADIRLPDGSGEDLYRKALPFLGDVPIVFATAFAEVEQAVRLVRAGADDYLTKPYDVDALVERIHAYEHDGGGQAVGTPDVGSTFPGDSPAMAAIASDLRRVAGRSMPVLLRGETGVGKEVAARYVHAQSTRAKQPFVAVNCAATTRELMESQFFGHERGAFTGALAARTGYFRETAGGTLFLDEIGELDARLQAALLRVLEDGSFRPLGGARDERFEGRIVAATNADLNARMAAGQFREDLYYRLATVEIVLPPLRERVDDILPLALRFLRSAGDPATANEHALTDDAQAALLSHPWPGNVRELRNRVERAVALADGPTLAAADFFPEMRLDGRAPLTLSDAREEAELRQIEQAIALSGGRVSDAAKRLGISRTTLWKRRRRSAG